MSSRTNRRALRVFGMVGIAAVVALLTQICRDPVLRHSLAWAFESWIRPPDADAAWEQEPA